MASLDNASDSGGSAAERFFKYFQYEITALQEQMARLGDTALVGGERKDATDHCLAGITRLSSEVKDVSATLPSYDLRTYSEAIKALQDKLAETQAQHAPKTRFSFKTRKNESAVSLHEAAELAAEKQRSILRFGTASDTSSIATTPVHPTTPPNDLATTHPRSAPSNLHAETRPDGSNDKCTVDDLQASGLTTTTNNTAISSQSDIHIILPASAGRADSTCTLSTLDRSCIDLSLPTIETAPYASLTVTNVQASVLLCGSIAGPAHITGVKNSTIVVSCRQLRMHDCEDVDVYLYCTSKPIIEDCNGIGFAEMPLFYVDLLHSAHPTSNQAIGTNMWEHVQDFKWLRPEQSPNWMTLPAQEQASEDTWRQIIPGKSSRTIDEILRTVRSRP